MLVRDLAVQLEDMAGQLDEQVRIQSARVHQVAAQVAGLHQQRLDSIEETMAMVSSRCDSALGHVGDLVQQRLKEAGVRDQLGAVGAHVEQLEATVIAGLERHGREIEALRSSHAQTSAETRSQQDADSSLRELFGQSEVRAEACETRLEDVLQFATDMGSAHEECFEELRRHDSELQSLKASMQDCMTLVEQSRDECGSKRQRLGRDLEGLQKRLSSEVVALVEQKHASLSGKLNIFELNMQETTDFARGQAHRVDAIKARHETLLKELRAQESMLTSIMDRISKLERALEEAEDERDRQLGSLEAQQDARVAHEKLMEQALAELETQRVAAANHFERFAQELSERQSAQAKSMELQLSSHEELLRQLHICDERSVAMERRLERLERPEVDRAGSGAVAIASVAGASTPREPIQRLAAPWAPLAPQASVSVLADRIEALERSMRNTSALQDEYLEALEATLSKRLPDMQRSIEETIRHKHEDSAAPLLKAEARYAEIRRQVELLDRRISDATLCCTEVAEEFARETRLVWQAIDAHTHDASGGDSGLVVSCDDGRSDRGSRQRLAWPAQLEGPRVDAASLRSASALASVDASPRSVRSLGAIAAAQLARRPIVAASSGGGSVGAGVEARHSVAQPQSSSRSPQEPLALTAEPGVPQPDSSRSAGARRQGEERQSTQRLVAAEQHAREAASSCAPASAFTMSLFGTLTDSLAVATRAQQA